MIDGIKLPAGTTYTRHSVVGSVVFADYVLGDGSIVVLPGPGTLMLVR